MSWDKDKCEILEDRSDYLGTDWILEIIEKEMLKLLSEYKMRDMENYGIISHMDKIGKELDWESW